MHEGLDTVGIGVYDNGIVDNACSLRAVYDTLSVLTYSASDRIIGDPQFY